MVERAYLKPRHGNEHQYFDNDRADHQTEDESGIKSIGLTAWAITTTMIALAGGGRALIAVGEIEGVGPRELARASVLEFD